MKHAQPQNAAATRSDTSQGWGVTVVHGSASGSDLAEAQELGVGLLTGSEEDDSLPFSSHASAAAHTMHKCIRVLQQARLRAIGKGGRVLTERLLTAGCCAPDCCILVLHGKPRAPVPVWCKHRKEG